MNGKKARLLRKMAKAVMPDLPKVEYAKQKIMTRHRLPGGKVIQLPFEQVMLGKCTRKIYKEMKKVYRTGLKGGLAGG